MKAQKIITVLLILVMVLQLLPVKQAVRYFFFDNLIAEEMTDFNKKATKNFKFFDEDHNITDPDFLMHHYLLVKSTLPFHFAELLPANHAADIHTPPPNHYSI